ncbi:MAG: hypothetical protein LBQ49_02855 [Rickettsiales bacterium]|jgi:hypothetical protein|nr:hypothetical protein [Rickettsiales bacterium]
MKKIILSFFILHSSFFIANGSFAFDDGLSDPTSKTEGQLDDTGAGIAGVETFNHAPNMEITRTRVEDGRAHGYYEYKITLDGRDITPDEFRTIEGADCMLQKFKFSFAPEFSITKISRPWEETWLTPTMAEKTVYILDDGELKASEPEELKQICDVTELF